MGLAVSEFWTGCKDRQMPCVCLWSQRRLRVRADQRYEDANRTSSRTLIGQGEFFGTVALMPGHVGGMQQIEGGLDMAERELRCDTALAFVAPLLESGRGEALFDDHFLPGGGAGSRQRPAITIVRRPNRTGLKWRQPSRALLNEGSNGSCR
ncbi:hypothetical protein GCM10009531_16180 [Actinoplanes capillaceus]